MDYGYIIAISILAISFAGYAIYSRRSIKALRKESLLITKTEPKVVPVNSESTLTEFERLGTMSFRTEEGDGLMECRELSKFPKKVEELDVTNSGYGEKVHLISDLVKAGVSAKGRSIELCFKADVQSKLNSGAAEMMKTKNGEVLADAVSNNRIIGKGRIIEGGRFKQMASAGFQLLSVAVAQSHLSDINDELKTISSKLEQVLEKLDSNDKTKIRGAISYLELVYKDILSGKEISAIRMQEFETCIRNTHEYFEGVIDEIERNTQAIEKYTSDETFGTGSTYEELKGYVDRLNTSIEKYELYLKLYLLSKMIRFQLDPTQTTFSVEKTDFSRMNELWVRYSGVSKSKINKMMKATFNARETLDVRIDSLTQAISNQVLRIEYVTHQTEAVSNRLDIGLNNFLDDKEYKMALSYGDDGELSRAAMLN